jgi:hypothetical protein
MTYDPRTIAFLAEVLYPPTQVVPEVVQGIHNSLFQQPELGYQSFQVAPDGIHLTNMPETPGSVSSVTFLPDRLILREELRATTLDDFATRLVNVAGISLEALKIPVSIAQQFVIRSLVTPRHVKDSREFLSQRLMSGSMDHWGKFDRPFESLGFRYTFPQHDDRPELFNLRIETWNQDPRSVWIENVGSFTQPVPIAEMPQLGAHLISTYQFLTGPVCEFIQEFDTP